jgi:DNA (cytosine-5)-methyltransferase 1
LEGSVYERASYFSKISNKKGFEEAYIGDCIDISYPKSKSRRGRVQRGISQTITCNPNLYVVVKKGKK